MIEVYRHLDKGEYAKALNAAEEFIYKKAYSDTNYNQSASAKLLDVSRTTFRDKMSKWKVL